MTDAISPALLSEEGGNMQKMHIARGKPITLYIPVSWRGRQTRWRAKALVASAPRYRIFSVMYLPEIGS